LEETPLNQVRQFFKESPHLEGDSFIDHLEEERSRWARRFEIKKKGLITGGIG
jgi:hypothetical protein